MRWRWIFSVFPDVQSFKKAQKKSTDLRWTSFSTETDGSCYTIPFQMEAPVWGHFGTPGPLTGKERAPDQTSKDSLLHSNVDCGKAKWVKFCFAWLSFTVPVIVLKSEEIPTTSPGKVSSSLLWKRLLLWWSSQLSSLFLALCIHVCTNFPCNNSFVIKWLE